MAKSLRMTLMEASIEVLKGYAASGNCEPSQFQEVLEETYETLKNFVKFVKKN